MKSRLATSIRSSFLCMNLRGRIPVSTLLVVIVTAAAWAQSAPAVSSAEARKAIQARVAMDKNTIERMLAPDLYVQTPDRKLTRQEFIDAIFSRPYTLTRFDATVLTVEPRGNDWAALVLEKLEGEIKDNSGKTIKIFGIVNAVLLRSLPFRDPDRLVRIYFNNPGVGLRNVRFSVPEFDDLRTQTDASEDVSVIVFGPTNLTGAKQPEHLEMIEVSPY